MNDRPNYAIIDGEGHYGSAATVWSVHTTEQDARRALRRSGSSVQLIAGCDCTVGEKIPRGVLNDLFYCGAWGRVDA